MAGGGLAEVEVDDAGLDEGGAGVGVDLEDAAHAVHGEEDAALDGECAATEAGAGAAGGDGEAVPAGEAEGGDDVFGAGGEGDGWGAPRSIVASYS